MTNDLVRVRVIKNCFFAGYGNVSIGTVIEMLARDAAIAVVAGRVEYVD